MREAADGGEPGRTLHTMLRNGRFTEALGQLERFSGSLCPVERASFRDVSLGMAARHLESGLVAGAAPLDQASAPSCERSALAAAAALEAADRTTEAEILFQQLNAGVFNAGTPMGYHFRADQEGRMLVRDVVARHRTRYRQPPPVVAPDYATILLHLNVTGGGALTTALGRLYLPWEVRDTSEPGGLTSLLDEIRTLHHWIPFIAWHSGSGWHVPFPADRFRILTMARHPLARFVSFYNTLLSHGDAPWVPSCVKQGLGIEALLAQLERGDGGNFFAKEICLLEVPGDAIGKLSPELLLGLTRSILERRFFLVGVTELFDASVAAAAMLMGFNHAPFWQHVHTSGHVPGRVLVQDLSPELQARIAALFALDVILYQEIKQRFEVDFADVIAFLERRKIRLQQPHASGP